MNYIVCESLNDLNNLRKVFKRLLDNDWMETPISGGKSEAISLSKALAFRHKRSKVILCIDLDQEYIGEDGMTETERRLIEYKNLYVVYAKPNLEIELIQMTSNVRSGLQLLFRSPKEKKEYISKHLKEFEEKGATAIQTEFYIKMSKILGT